MQLTAFSKLASMQINNLLITNEIEDLVSIKWSVIDGEWTYMDTYIIPKSEYEKTTPEELLERQTAQYLNWRNYCENPQG